LKGLPGNLQTDTKSLDESQGFHRFSDIRIAIVRSSRRTKIFTGDPSKRATRVLDFDTVPEPGKLNGSVRGFVIAMHYRISDELLKRRNGVIWALLLGRMGLNICGDPNIRF